MRASITYCESVTMSKFSLMGASCANWSTAVSSPALFVLSELGSRIDLFQGSPSPYYIPPPATAFSLPLYSAEPFVYTIRGGLSRSPRAGHVYIGGLGLPSARTLKLSESVFIHKSGSKANFAPSSPQGLSFTHSDSLWSFPGILRSHISGRRSSSFTAAL